MPYLRVRVPLLADGDKIPFILHELLAALSRRAHRSALRGQPTQNETQHADTCDVKQHANPPTTWQRWLDVVIGVVVIHWPPYPHLTSSRPSSRALHTPPSPHRDRIQRSRTRVY